MRVLSPFDGMACGMLAILEAGIDVERYVAFEIDKYAIKSATHNFPMIEERGDVFKADFTEFRGFDFLVGGSPCTFWSIAKTSGRETEASGMGWELFSQYVRALREAQPRWFVYENNKSMSNAIRESITKTFGFEPICINSALVSAQNRQRLYWVGRRNDDGSYSKVDISQPEDRGILLKDVLDGVAKRIPAYGQEDKSRPLGANYPNNCGGFEHRMFSNNPHKQQVDMIAEPVNTTKDGKSQTIKAQYQQTSVANICCYTSTYGATGVAEPVPAYATPCEWDENGNPVKAISAADGKTYTVYEVKDGFITIKGKRYAIKLADGFYIIRKLTVSECKRLQTVPEWYEFPVSDSRAYQQLGNGWTILIISHLIKACLKTTPTKDATFCNKDGEYQWF